MHDNKFNNNYVFFVFYEGYVYGSAEDAISRTGITQSKYPCAVNKMRKCYILDMRLITQIIAKILALVCQLAT